MELVHGGMQRSDTGAIRRSLQGRVEAGALEDVVALVIKELHQLHEGNIVRYRLRPSEFGHWPELQPGDEE